MNALLICPSRRPSVELLAENFPLSNAPLLGQSLLQYWLGYLACSGIKRVMILADDRPDEVQALIGNGERWGLKTEVVPESRELTPAQALLKYEHELDSAASQSGIAVLDHFPGLSQYPVFTSYRDWFAAVQAWLPLAKTPDRVGLRELKPGVWAGLNTRISSKAELRAPCWLGNNVWIGAHAVVGPRAFVENGSFIEPAATLSNSFVGPDTFVGRFAELKDSLVCGNVLINWRSESAAKVPDTFLLCSLKPARTPGAVSAWLERIAELCSRHREEQDEVFAKQFLINKEG